MIPSAASAAHARFAPSAASRWMSCTASVTLCEQTPASPSGPDAVRGTRAHALLAALLSSSSPSSHVWSFRDCAYIDAPTEGVYDDDMLTSVFSAHVAILHHISEIGAPDLAMWIEQRVRLPSTGELCGGTADIALWSPSLRLLIVVDFKNGVVPVEARENAQLMTYGVGAMDTFGLEPERIDLAVVQPRAFKADVFDVWSTDATRLRQHEADVLRAIESALSPSPRFSPSRDNCRWCDAAAYCPAQDQLALTTIREDFASVNQLSPVSFPEPAAMSPDRLSRIMMASPFLKKWLDQVEERVADRIRAGLPVPGFKLVRTQERRSFVPEMSHRQIAEALGREIGFPPDDLLKIALPGVVDTERFVKAVTRSRVRGRAAGNAAAEAASHVLARYMVRMQGNGTTVVPLEDPRPPLVPGAEIGTVYVPPLGT